jgi:hypothetical protein
MIRRVTAISDRLLQAVVPKAAASAACTPRCGYNDSYCDRNGIYHYRTCCIDYFCHLYSCSAWRTIRGC